jgi:hypothetical protein
VVVCRLFSYFEVTVDGYDFYWSCAVVLVLIVLHLTERINEF